ncbi:heterodisulfide reductase subunit C [Desulfobaculum xiamenense]|uniref:Heterodisulfide reductase subunit C n=1 Tax=Desulfobaculum xiamenense TaxID=995050 RepID=A0A846QRJ3_9BACT|nr:4Fe-4S dicluster domain-containing protein [Desulfobaculum xiamenense]NJB67289.1 heterodisulfide reductase subunit C [Desulfobaculum xiamenense]
MNRTARQTWSPGRDDGALAELRGMVQACMQCGTCTASCPNAFAMDVTPRQMWRMIQFGMLDRILDSRTYWFCSSCYACTLRCPRGLRLTSAMAALKRLAAERGGAVGRGNGAFYAAFMDNVEKYGRAQEALLMQEYFIRKKDPLLPLSFAGLGLRMLGKGRLHMPKLARKPTLRAIFAKAREIGGAS